MGSDNLLTLAMTRFVLYSLGADLELLFIVVYWIFVDVESFLMYSYNQEDRSKRKICEQRNKKSKETGGMKTYWCLYNSTLLLLDSFHEFSHFWYESYRPKFKNLAVIMS